MTATEFAVSLAMSVLTGLVSGFYVARRTAFDDVKIRACLALREFAIDESTAERSRREFHMCRDQFDAMGFPSVRPMFHELIEWAEKFIARAKVCDAQGEPIWDAEIPGKPSGYMKALETLKPTWREMLLHWARWPSRPSRDFEWYGDWPVDIAKSARQRALIEAADKTL